MILQQHVSPGTMTGDGWCLPKSLTSSGFRYYGMRIGVSKESIKKWDQIPAPGYFLEVIHDKIPYLFMFSKTHDDIFCYLDRLRIK